MNQAASIPALPEIGHPETYYAKRVHHADKLGDAHAHEGFKVGQYITLALDPRLPWERKLRYFQHAIQRHCTPPRFPDDQLWLFYRGLADLVRTYAGQEALRLSLAEDELYDKRVRDGILREDVEEDAALFFRKLIPFDACPEWFHEVDYAQLKMIRDQWI